jgi:hypothetical protein
MNILQVLTITSVGYVLFAILWVTEIEDYLEERELNQKRPTDRRQGREGSEADV